MVKVLTDSLNDLILSFSLRSFASSSLIPFGKLTRATGLKSHVLVCKVS